MKEVDKKGGRGGWRGGVRPTTDLKVPLMVRISPEAKAKIDTVHNKSEFIDSAIKKLIK